MTDLLLVLILVALGIALALLALLLRARGRTDPALTTRLEALQAASERLERALREEQRGAREEQTRALSQFGAAVSRQIAAMAQQQDRRSGDFGERLDQFTQRTDQRLDGLRQALLDDARKTREEGAQALQAFGGVLEQRLGALAAGNEQRLTAMRTTLEEKLAAIQHDNAAKLEQMRATVDEKLQSTLEARLGQSFQQVSDQLEKVYKGLGEMQSLATGVGDLKRVLGNVKTRGIFGEVQLGMLLEQVLTPEQYASNFAPVPGGGDRVEFAIRLPGATSDAPVWLPIDAKFPREDYERLLDAQDRADAEGVAAAAAALERRLRDEARTIRSKYIAPPHTTDFAILFLPTEGLYAEALRRPGLFEALQREHRVTVAGPTTLNALLNSLQMGFRTLAIQQRSSEVWQLLGAVKTEFGRFGGVLDKVKKKLDEASGQIEATGVRTRAIERKLREVESLLPEESQALLGDAALPATEVEPEPEPEPGD